MSEKNPCWLPIVRLEPDPVERLLRTLWSYEKDPVRILTAQRYRLVMESEPLPSVRAS